MQRINVCDDRTGTLPGCYRCTKTGIYRVTISIVPLKTPEYVDVFLMFYLVTYFTFNFH